MPETARKIRRGPHHIHGSAMSPQPVASLQTEVRRLLGLVLRRRIGEQENPSRSTEPAWDSLKHVEFVFLVEDHFGLRFTEEEMAGFDGVEQMVRVLEARHATPPND